MKRFVQMKINEHLIFNLTNAVRKCITLNIKAYNSEPAHSTSRYRVMAAVPKVIFSVAVL